MRIEDIDRLLEDSPDNKEAIEELQESIDILIGRLSVFRGQVDALTISEILEFTLNFNQINLILKNQLEDDSSPDP